MPNPPRLPKASVVARIRAQVARNDRTPFADILADALSVAPSKTAFRQLARQNPRQYVSMVKELAELNGYAQRTEHRRVNIDATAIAAEIAARMGADKAREILPAFGLPSTLVPDTAPDDVISAVTPESGEGDT